MMRFLVAHAVNPQMSLLDGLRDWNSIAASLREPPRKRRRYQGEALETFLSYRLWGSGHDLAKGH